jgi:phosphoribosylcarboxyaminoimidazole (NCAIR) mutase
MEILSSLHLPSGVASAVVLEPENAALAAAKILGVDDTVLFGRVLVSQYRSRKNVIESDARLNAAPPNGKAGA